MPLTKVKSGGVSDSITLTSPDINAPDIDGGTIDNAVIGGSTAAAGSFTTITATGGSSSNWNTAYGWGDHSTQSYATQTYVGTAVSNLVDSSPAALDTLNELAAALGDDPNFATTVTNSIALKAPLASPSFTGNVTMATGGTIVAGGANDLILNAGESGTPDIYLQSGSSTKVKIEGSNGNVGIAGQTNPTYKLDGGFADQTWGWYLNSSYNAGFTYNTTERSLLISTKSAENIDHIKFATGGAATERMRIDSSGNVGIGTVPQSNLDIDVGIDTNLGLRSQTGVIVAQYTGAPAVGNRAQIGLGYGNTYTNVSIGAVRTSAAAYGTDDFIIATKSGTGDTAPTERMRIDSSGRVTMPYQPTWGASSLSNTSASGGTTSAGTLVFSGVLNNNGNHYSNSTGLFTAPVAGQYFVTFSGLYDDSYSVTGAVYIRRNTSNLYRGYHQNSGSSYLQISMSGVVECSVGDTISIYSAIAGWHIGGETSFSGFLIG